MIYVKFINPLEYMFGENGLSKICEAVYLDSACDTDVNGKPCFWDQNSLK